MGGARLRLVIATPEFPPHAGGGLGRFYADLAPALVRAGVEVTVVVAAATSGDFDAYERDGVHVRPVSRAAIDARAAGLPHLSAAPVFRRWLAGAQAARDAAADLAPDCVETTDFGLQFVPFVAEPFACPVIVQAHGSLGQISQREPPDPSLALDDALARLTEATVLAFADEVQTYSASNASEWSARLERPVVVLPPPVRSEFADGSGAPGADGLVVGRVQTWKGPEVLCQAVALTPPTPPVKIRWVGRDTDTAPDGGSLSRFLTSTYPGIWGGRIVHEGQRPRAEVAALQRTARFVVVPSEWDVYNLTAAEAMQAGRVVICSDGAGASDLIESGRNGFVFAAGDAGSLAGAIGQVLALDPDAARRVGERARESATRALDPDAAAVVRVERMQQLIQSRRARPAVPDWVRGFVTGGLPADATRGFLDQVSLKDLSRYVGKRAGERLWSRVGGRAARRSS